MTNTIPLAINKSTAHIPIRKDVEIDVTAIRIGKQRFARKKDTKLSDLKKAILDSRARQEAPHISTAECPLDDPGNNVPQISSDTSVHSCGPMDDVAFACLKELARLQAKGKDQPAEKQYKYKKFIVGFREVQRALQRSELKGIIVAVNLEDVDELTNLVEELESKSQVLEVPIIRALTRRRMGKALGKSMRQSLVGILNLDGVHQQWKQIRELATAR